MRWIVVLGLLGCRPATGGELEDVDDDGVLSWLDCDDADDAVGAPTVEVCNGLDDDCDGEIDEGAIGGALVYPDEDGDGFGVDRAQVVCDPGEGFADRGGD